MLVSEISTTGSHLVQDRTGRFSHQDARQTSDHPSSVCRCKFIPHDKLDPYTPCRRVVELGGVEAVDVWPVDAELLLASNSNDNMSRFVQDVLLLDEIAASGAEPMGAALGAMVPCRS